MKENQYWLMKSEPTSFSIDDLQRDGFTDWEGVRNFQARNTMRDEMKPGDLALFYHSNGKSPGVAGVCRICSSSKPDSTQWDPSSKYYDKKASPENPIWELVEVEFVDKFRHYVTLKELKAEPGLKDMVILRKGNRLSITPVTRKEFELICQLAQQEAAVSPDLIQQRQSR